MVLAVLSSKWSLFTVNLSRIYCVQSSKVISLSGWQNSRGSDILAVYCLLLLMVELGVIWRGGMPSSNIATCSSRYPTLVSS